MPTTSSFRTILRFAYTSNEDGVAAAFVQPFLTGAKPIAVGTHPLCSDGNNSRSSSGPASGCECHDAAELYFWRPTPIPAYSPVTILGADKLRHHPDGRRFIIVTQAGQSPSGAPTMPQTMLS